MEVEGRFNERKQNTHLRATAAMQLEEEEKSLL